MVPRAAMDYNRPPFAGMVNLDKAIESVLHSLLLELKQSGLLSTISFSDLQPPPPEPSSHQIVGHAHIIGGAGSNPASSQLTPPRFIAMLTTT